MFRSDWSLGWDGYSDTGLPEPFPAVAWQTLKFLHTQRGVVAHGHEPLDADNTPQMLSEAWVLQHGFVEYEGVANLHLVPPTGCLLAAGFPRVVGATGGLSRLVAICPHSSRHGVTIAQAPAGPLAEHEWPMRRDPDGVLRPRKGAQRVQGCPADMPLMAGCVDGKLVD